MTYISGQAPSALEALFCSFNAQWQRIVQNKGLELPSSGHAKIMNSKDNFADLRAAARRRTLKGARIVYPGGFHSVFCRIRDISATGAQLILEEQTAMPDRFTLVIDRGEATHECHLVWQKGDKAGVSFVTNQVVESVSEPPAQSERRSPLLRHPIKM